MRTFLHLTLTSFIATGAMLAGLNQRSPLLGYAIGLAAWAFFFWRWDRRNKRTNRNKKSWYHK